MRRAILLRHNEHSALRESNAAKSRNRSQEVRTRKGFRCKPPEMQPWEIRVLYLSDPTGVPWHLTDTRKS